MINMLLIIILLSLEIIFSIDPHSTLEMPSVDVVSGSDSKRERRDLQADNTPEFFFEVLSDRRAPFAACGGGIDGLECERRFCGDTDPSIPMCEALCAAESLCSGFNFNPAVPGCFFLAGVLNDVSSVCRDESAPGISLLIKQPVTRQPTSEPELEPEPERTDSPSFSPTTLAPVREPEPGDGENVVEEDEANPAEEQPISPAPQPNDESQSDEIAVVTIFATAFSGTIVLASLGAFVLLRRRASRNEQEEVWARKAKESFGTETACDDGTSPRFSWGSPSEPPPTRDSYSESDSTRNFRLSSRSIMSNTSTRNMVKKASSDPVAAGVSASSLPAAPQPSRGVVWEEATDPMTGSKYYFDRVSGATSWEVPPGFNDGVVRSDIEIEMETNPMYAHAESE